MPALLILLTCCACALPHINDPHTARALVQNAIAIYQRDDLLHENFFSDDNIKRLTGAATVMRLRTENVPGADWDELIYTKDFVNMEPPTKVWRPDLNMPTVRFEPSRWVKDKKLISARLFVVFQAEYADTRRSLIVPLLGRACQEDQGQEGAKFMAFTMETFNPPLGNKRPNVVSCTGAHKKMTLDFGLADPGGDPMLSNIQIDELSR